MEDKKELETVSLAAHELAMERMSKIVYAVSAAAAVSAVCGFLKRK